MNNGHTTKGGRGELAEHIGGEVGRSITDSLQHVELLREKELKLEAARHEAEHQLLHRIGVALRAGEITLAHLVAIYVRYSALGFVGRKTRWDEHIDIKWKALPYLARHLPNGPEGSWVGEYPLDERSVAPKGGLAVVYVLFDVSNEPCYVGSTDAFRTRMAAHQREGKNFVRWQAHPARDREHAYRLEDRLLKEHKPYLNKKASR